MSWSEHVWELNAARYSRILEMPFIRELRDGSLSPERFAFYIGQDARYLEQFSRALAIIGARLPVPELSLAFYRFAQAAITVEQALHASHFSVLGIPADVQAEPICHHYGHFLISQATLQPVEVAMASVLPCFRVYREVGQEIRKSADLAANSYRRWIETYADADFDRSVRELTGFCDAAAEETTPAIRAAMTAAFTTAFRLEYRFWEAAYHRQTWEHAAAG